MPVDDCTLLHTKLTYAMMGTRGTSYSSWVNSADGANRNPHSVCVEIAEVNETRHLKRFHDFLSTLLAEFPCLYSKRLNN